MKIEDINRTFPKHKAALQEIFLKNLNVPDSRFVPSRFPIVGDGYLLILEELLSGAQQTKMYLKIRSEFAPDTDLTITSDV